MTILFNDIFRNKKVLVTGHTGFKGAWLTLWLVALGADVIGYALEPDTTPNLYDSLNLRNKITHITGDVRDENHLNNVFQQYKPKIVFHLAAQPLVRYSYSHPKLTYETNVMGTVNLYEAARKADSVRVIVNVTSDKCYENKEWDYGYRETDRLGGFDPYSNSKGVSEMITSAYRNSFFNPKDFDKLHNIALASARAGNVIGGGDWALDRLIPDCIRSLTVNEKIVIRCPQATRPWQFVLEPLSGYLTLASLMWNDGVKYSEGWNFGPADDSVLKVQEIVTDVVNLWGSGDVKFVPDDNLHEAGLLKLDISKAKRHLGWNPTYNAKKAIKETVSWYKAFYSKQNMLEYSEKQLNQYIQASQAKKINWGLTNEELIT